MNSLFIISRLKKWTIFNYFRATANFLMGIGLCFIALITINREEIEEFKGSPWILPTISLVFFFVLVLNHLPKHPPLFFRTKSSNSAETSGLLSPFRLARRSRDGNEAIYQSTPAGHAEDGYEEHDDPPT
jgi:hypothetical protein